MPLSSLYPLDNGSEDNSDDYGSLIVSGQADLRTTSQAVWTAPPAFFSQHEQVRAQQEAPSALRDMLCAEVLRL